MCVLKCFNLVLFVRQSFTNSSPKAGVVENGFVGFPEVEECIMRDMETQTANTPPLSRSSSCTCLSECSSSVFNTGKSFVIYNTY